MALDYVRLLSYDRISLIHYNINNKKKGGDLFMTFLGVLIGFLISLIISAIIIYLAAKLFGERETFGTAILAALIGAIIFTIVTYFLGGWIASVIGGIAWLIALSNLYNMGWLKAIFVAMVIWIFAGIVSWILPTIAGPL